MKKSLFLILLFTFTSILHSQNIVDFFYLIPKEHVDGLTYSERQKLVQNGSLAKDDMLYNLDLDQQNGYLKLDQSYTEGQAGYQIFEMTYWNLMDKKLIALSSIGGSNGGFSQSNFKFFEYKTKKFTELKTGYLKSYTSNFDVFINNLIGEFTKPNVTQAVKEDLSVAQFTIELPKAGKDLSVSFDDNYMAAPDFFDKNYSKYLKTKKKIYTWNSAKELFE